MSGSENPTAGKPVILKRRESPNAEKEPSIGGRPALRESPRDEAARYAAELRAHRGERPISDDPLDVTHLEPDGWKYEWHTWSIYEQRQNRNMMDSTARGWRPVPRERHPELMPKDSDQEVIIDKGLMLVELPREIADEYRHNEIREARDQVRYKEQALAGTPEGTMTRTEDPRTRPKINKSFEAMSIPD
jgi:hypothetical protein